ncbi:hypothetical protein [Micromonospora narathiwatensis]|uniref:Uncharacterized protein n=1 Tax=Micromonospora narathiwatensis TaxID=299146 RepID=A0A1A8ZMN1_9ACTN|nr:hypothetical protein [Micromonospora narathiwatensis]SBT45353.1 hypothetical protein GA0070621_2318 [Micromonospora narathiwatensis]
MTDDPRPAGDHPAIQPPGPVTPVPHTRLNPIELSGWAQATVVYIGSAVAAGVLGNIAYDGLKAALGRLRRGKVSPEPRLQDPDLVLLARTAVNVRCTELGIDGQAGADLNATCMPVSDGWEVLFRRLPHGVTASVRLSVDDQRADVKAEVRLPEELVSQRPEVKDDGGAVGVLRAADGWEQSPPA